MERKAIETKTRENAARKLMRETVRETLISLGFDTENPHETQADMLYLRRLREGREELARRFRLSLAAAGASALLYAVWEAVRQNAE